MFMLKDYQTRSLAALHDYLEQARFKGAEAAYRALEKTGVPDFRPYQPTPNLQTVPFVCLRLPTGGGKTLLSAHTVAIAGETYLETEFPLVLWLVPTNTIRQQTLETLKRPGHPNYETLRAAYDGRFMVLDIEDFTQIRPQDLRSKAVIVLGTIQTLRVNSTEGRKVYAHNENLEPHFTKVSESHAGLERIEEGDNAGKIKYSFRNLLHLHRPLVIVDEAHNASSDLSFEVLERVNAACVIEYTATPADSSNVLHNVSASELKAEEMIKLPIILTEHKTWEEAVGDAIRTRDHLCELAKKDKDYIRPIVLFQAEKKGKDITKEVMLDYLVNQEKIDRERIAIVTGEQRELDGINLSDSTCPIDFVITVEALKEGWDCSFAYVFCSVATVHSKKDVEQILGRVLRMPYAKRRAQEELNKAYAHVSATSWPQSVQLLHDRLVSMGFDQQEADSFIERQPRLAYGDAPEQKFSEPAPLVLELREEPDLSSFDLEEHAAITVAKSESGFAVTVKGNINDFVAEKLVKAAAAPDRKHLETNLKVYRQTWKRHVSPAEQGVAFTVPQLCLWVDGELELAEKENFLDARGWNLLGYPAELTETEFKLTDNGKKYEIDIIGDKIRERLVGETDQLNLDIVDTGWTDLHLSRWLDGRLRQQDIRQEVLLEYLRKTVAFLSEKRSIPVPALVRGRFLLVKVLQEKIKKFRKDAYEKGYQQTLFAPNAKVETSFEYGFAFGRHDYAPRWSYEGSYQFNKHFYDRVGELKSKGEEYECAKAIDMHPAVKQWVRNIERHEKSFWLPTSSDKFYPDFVAELTDGRTLVIEYKGEAYATNDDSKEKINIGQLWEEKSGGKALFLFALKSDAKGRSVHDQITQVVEG